jgi:hypothetical protein
MDLDQKVPGLPKRTAVLHMPTMLAPHCSLLLRPANACKVTMNKSMPCLMLCKVQDVSTLPTSTWQLTQLSEMTRVCNGKQAFVLLRMCSNCSDHNIVFMRVHQPIWAIGALVG